HREVPPPELDAAQRTEEDAPAARGRACDARATRDRARDARARVERSAQGPRGAMQATRARDLRAPGPARRARVAIDSGRALAGECRRQPLGACAMDRRASQVDA